MEDREKQIYRKIREMKKGSLVQKKQAIKCEKILADECLNKNLNEKLNMINDIINDIK